MTANTERWLEIHARALDTVRAVLDGLDESVLRWVCPATGMSIAADVAHLCGSEVYWMREVKFQPNVQRLDPAAATREELLAALDAVESEHARLVRERPGDKDVLFSLGRVCQHAIYHTARMAYFRLRKDPTWKVPQGSGRGGWAVPVDLITETMLGR